MNPNALLSSLLLSLAAHTLSGCSSCGKGEVLATLEAKQGQVQRNAVVADKAWQDAAVGVGFAVGDAIRTAHDSNALLGLDDGAKLRVRQDTVVRFLTRLQKKDHKQSFDIEAGQVLLETGEQAFQLVTQTGTARLDARSVLLIRRTPAGMQFDVTVGKALLETADGGHEIEQGKSFIVSVGGAIVEPSDAIDAGHAAKPGVVPRGAGVDRATAEGGISAHVTGSGVSQKGPTDSTFQNVPAGDTKLLAGSMLKVDATSRVDLESGGAKTTLKGAGTYRLLAEQDGLVELQSGRLAVNGASRIVVPGGALEVVDQAAATVETLDRNHTRLRVTKGTALVVGNRDSTKLAAGEEATLDADGATKVVGRGLDYADIAINAGESCVVHDPKPPTAIRFLFAGRCAGRGSIRVLSKAAEQFATGEGAVTLALGVGRHDYGLSCPDETGPATTPVARGSLTVVRDSGTRPVPKTPPSTAVHVDGHGYTIMYQNQLPSVTVVWPNAPAAASYTLHVESRSGKKVLTLSSPSNTFASGALAEGHHEVYFEGGNRFSRHSGLDIVFDNAAPMASLSTPIEPDLGASGDVSISGVALPGWQVEVGGIPLSQDGQQRFSQQVTAPSTERALAVKLVHPTRGTHIFVRRIARPHE